MRTRLLIGLLAAGLTGAMLPVTAMALEEDRLGQCIKADEVGTNAEGGLAHVGKNSRGEDPLLEFWTLPGQSLKGIENPISNGQGPDVGLILISCGVAE